MNNMPLSLVARMKMGARPDPGQDKFKGRFQRRLSAGWRPSGMSTGSLKWESGRHAVCDPPPAYSCFGGRKV